MVLQKQPNKNLGLINYYSRFNQFLASHDILHANALKETKKATTENQNVRKLDIEYKIPNTNTKTTKSIQYLESLDDVDICSWIEKFKFYCHTFNWNETVKLSYLRELIEIEIESLHDGSKNAFEILSELIQMKMEAQSVNVLQSSIRLIDQDDYYLIEQYKNEIFKAAKECKILKNWNDERYEEYLNELFMNNLSRDIKILFTSSNLCS